MTNNRSEPAPDYHALGVAMARPSRQPRALEFMAALQTTLEAQAAKQQALNPIVGNALATSQQEGAALVWGQLLDLLASSSLTPALICSRSGRYLGTIKQEQHADHLALIARLGDTRAADDMLERLLAAIVIQKAQAVAPVVLTTSAANLAAIRQASPIDFLIIAINHLAPIAKDATATERAQRAEFLGLARVNLETLPAAPIHYACECAALLLSYIDPRRVIATAPTEWLLSVYHDAPQSAFESAASLAHFSGRIMQQIAQLVSVQTMRPLDQISQGDMLALRVHWVGLPQYKTLRAERRAIMNQLRDDLPNYKIPQIGSRYDLPEISGGIDTAALLDAFDIALTRSLHGMPTKLATQTQAQEEAARAAHKRVADAQEATKARAALLGDDPAPMDALQFDDILSLSDMLGGDIDASAALTIESDDDLITSGLCSMQDLLAADDDFDDLGAVDDVDALEAMPNLLGDLMQQAKPTRRKVKSAPTRGTDHSAELVAAVEKSLASVGPDGKPKLRRRRV